MMTAETTSWTVGNGGGVYDPVTTSDNVQFSDQKAWLTGRPRTYNFGTYKKSGMKAVCDEIRNRSRPKCLFATFIATVFLILLLLIIVIVSTRHADSGMMEVTFEKWVAKSTGLNSLPAGVDNSVLIKYSHEPGNEDSYSSYIGSLDKVLENYKTSPLRNHSHELCNATYNPGNVICQQPLTLFGMSCTKTHKYGYPAGQPCILLFLTLPKDYTARSLLPKDGDSYVMAEKALNSSFSLEHIGVSCKPATHEDAQYVDMTSTSAVGTAPIEYNPPKGFPTYFFRQRTVDTFIPPAVMVQFRTIRASPRDGKSVRFTCTAWGKAFTPDGQLVNDNGIFTTPVVFSIH